MAGRDVTDSELQGALLPFSPVSITTTTTLDIILVICLVIVLLLLYETTLLGLCAIPFNEIAMRDYLYGLNTGQIQSIVSQGLCLTSDTTALLFYRRNKLR